VGLAVLLYLALALPQLGRALSYDEVDFARAAASVAAPGAAGVLRYDRAYIADYPAAPDAGQRLQFALWHPPGYLLTLGLWRRLDPGAGDAWLRLFGVVCGLGTLLLTAALGRAAGGPAGGGPAALLWALSPFAVQSALLLDAEGTVLPLATAACVLLALRASADRSPSAGALGAVAAAFGAALWTKPATALAVFGLLVVWLGVQRGRTAGVRLVLAGLAGLAGACLLWLGFALLAGLPPSRPLQDFAAALVQVGERPLPAVYLVGLIRGAQWLHPLLFCLLVAAPLAFSRARPGAALLFAGGGGAVLLLGKLAAGYPKYLAGPLPLLAAAAGGALATWLVAGERRPISHLPLALAGALAGAALTALSGPDALVRGAGLPPLTLWLAVAAALLALGAPLGAARPAALACGLLAGAGLTTAAYQATLPTSTTYFYGASGQVEAGRWLRQTQPPEAREGGAAITAPAAVADREVAYYAGDVHFVDTERWLDVVAGVRPAAPPLDLDGVRVVVSRDGRASERFGASGTPVATFGDYRAWRLDPGR
jgi:hypothetical protein